MSMTPQNDHDVALWNMLLAISKRKTPDAPQPTQQRRDTEVK